MCGGDAAFCQITLMHLCVVHSVTAASYTTRHNNVRVMMPLIKWNVKCGLKPNSITLSGSNQLRTN